MKIIIKTKNLESSEALEDFIEEKILGLKKFIDVLKDDSGVGKTLAEVFVEIEKETKHHKSGNIYLAKAQLQLPGKKMIVARAKADMPSKAIVLVKKELKKEIEKYKGKKIALHDRKIRKLKELR